MGNRARDSPGLSLWRTSADTGERCASGCLLPPSPARGAAVAGRRRAGQGRGPASWWSVPSASSRPQRRRSCRPVRWVRQPGCGGATGPAGPDVGTSRGWRCWPGRRRAGRGRGPASWWSVPSASSGPQRRRSCRPVRWVRQPGCGGATGPAGPDVGTSRGWRCWPGRRRAGRGRGPASWCCGAAGSAWLRCASVPGLDVPGDPVPHRPVIPAAGRHHAGGLLLPMIVRFSP